MKKKSLSGYHTRNSTKERRDSEIVLSFRGNQNIKFTSSFTHTDGRSAVHFTCSPLILEKSVIKRNSCATSIIRLIRFYTRKTDSVVTLAFCSLLTTNNCEQGFENSLRCCLSNFHIPLRICGTMKNVSKIPFWDTQGQHINFRNLIRAFQ
jgi:hypothetical protein